MRIVAGTYRSRRLVAPGGLATRPTADKLRETLFNVLAARTPGARFADLYAGSGAVGLEALSRGAVFCCFAEKSPEALAAIRANVAALGIAAAEYTLEGRGVARLLATDRGYGAPWDVVFLDPPYDAEREYASTLQALSSRHEQLLSADALVVAEHARKAVLPLRVGVLEHTRLLVQGDAALSFFEVRMPS